jgi:ketosteroid isomerase-like protein
VPTYNLREPSNLGSQGRESDAVEHNETEFREGYNPADTDRILNIVDPDLVDFSHGQPSEFGGSGLDALKTRLANLFERFTAELVVIVIEIEKRSRGHMLYMPCTAPSTGRLPSEATKRMATWMLRMTKTASSVSTSPVTSGVSFPLLAST